MPPMCANPEPGYRDLRMGTWASSPLVLNPGSKPHESMTLDSRTFLELAPYRSAITTGAGAPFGVDRYPVTVFLALTLLTTISYNMGSLPLKNWSGRSEERRVGKE